MRNRKMKVTALAFILISVINAQAQISIKSEYISSSKFKDEDGNNSGGKGDLKTVGGNITIPVSVKINENNKPTAWMIALGGTYASIEGKNLSKEYYLPEIWNGQLGVMHLRPLSNKWSILASLGVGLYTSDPKKISGKSFLGQGGVLFIRHARANFEWGAGVAINNALGYPMVFPSIYLDWKLEGKYEFIFSMFNSFELGIKKRITDYFRLGLIAEMNGLTSAVEKNGKSMYFITQYGYFGIRPEFIIGKTVSIPITCGISFAREMYFQSRTLKGLFENKENYPHFGVSAYFSVGVRYGF